MSNCITCGGRVNNEKEKAYQAANEKAKKENIPVAVYKENGEWKICNAFVAYAEKYPVEYVVSVNNDIPTA